MKLVCFVKEQQNWPKEAVKITLQYKDTSTLCEKGKIAREKFLRLKRKILSIFLSFEGKRIHFGASKSKLGRFEIRRIVKKWGLFVQFKGLPFGKSTNILLDLSFWSQTFFTNDFSLLTKRAWNIVPTSSWLLVGYVPTTPPRRSCRQHSSLAECWCVRGFPGQFCFLGLDGKA